MRDVNGLTAKSVLVGKALVGRAVLLALALNLFVGASACGDDDDDAETADAGETSDTTADATGDEDTSAAADDDDATGDRDWQDDEVGSNPPKEVPDTVFSDCGVLCGNIAAFCAVVFPNQFEQFLGLCVTDCQASYERDFTNIDDEVAKTNLKQSERCLTAAQANRTCYEAMYCVEWLFPEGSPYRFVGFGDLICLERCETQLPCLEDGVTFETCMSECREVAPTFERDEAVGFNECLFDAGLDCDAQSSCGG